MIVKFNIPHADYYFGQIYNALLRYEDKKVGRFIKSEFDENGDYIVSAKIFKKYEYLIKDKNDC